MMPTAGQAHTYHSKYNIQHTLILPALCHAVLCSATTYDDTLFSSMMFSTECQPIRHYVTQHSTL